MRVLHVRLASARVRNQRMLATPVRMLLCCLLLRAGPEQQQEAAREPLCRSVEPRLWPAASVRREFVQFVRWATIREIRDGT